MCGIAGIIVPAHRPTQVDETELIAMREAMARRGPDGAGLWRSEDGRIGLAHRRLAVIDPTPDADQPMASADGRLVIVFNGEILNYRDLRRELERDGHRFRTRSDTEVLLHLYDRHGEAMVERLRGMYAFALWDAGGRRLFAARDPFGILPFYYSSAGGVIRFASQVKALRRASAISDRLDPAGQAGFLLFGYVAEPHTLYTDIRALPAGTILTVEASGRIAERRFFDIADELARAVETPAPGDKHERRALLHDALLDSVRHHLVADVPVGLFLSAGVDSNALLSLASEAGVPELRTVTLGFPEYRGDPRDETGLARASAEAFGAQHETRWISSADFAADSSQLLDEMDQPSIDGANTYFVAKVAAATGLKVALSGIGGDELFGGYPAFRQVPALARTLGPFGRLPTLGRWARQASAPFFRRAGKPKLAGLIEYGSGVAAAYLLRRGLFMPWELPALMGSEAARDGLEIVEPIERLAFSIDGLRGDRARIATLELSWYMRNQLLRDTDWAGLAHSLEIRPPFVDLTLFRRILPLLLGRHPVGKADVLSALARPVPDAIARRPKSGFAVPWRQWLLGHLGTEGIPLRAWALHVYRRWVPA